MAERSHMCWELGHFQTLMFVKEPGKWPTEPAAGEAVAFQRICQRQRDQRYQAQMIWPKLGIRQGGVESFSL